MTAATELVDKKLLRSLVPLNGLSKPHFEEVARKGVIEQFRAGKVLFKQGKRDGQTYFLLSGEISLLEGKEVKSVIVAGSEEARHPLAPHQPRQFTARVKSPATVLRIDTGLLDVFLAWDQSSAYEVTEIQSDDDEDWMTRMLSSDLFARLPASNIQQIIMRMEALEIQAGTVIVEQDEQGDYYYIIKQGVAMITRKPSANARPVKVAELRDGDSFGEEALVSGGARNATVTMVTDGALMRLSKTDFDALLRAPLIKNLSFDEAKKLVADGAIWVDVRLPGEYSNTHLPGSVNLPLAAIRETADQLDIGKRYVVCCDSGTRSAGAAFLLNQIGYDTYVLEGGLRSVAYAEMSESGDGVEGKAARATGAEIIDFKGGRDVAAGQGGGDEAVKLERRIGDLQQEIVRLRAELEERGTLLSQRERELEDTRLASDTAARESSELGTRFNELSRKIEAETRAREQLEQEKQQLQDELARLGEQQAQNGVEIQERVNALQAELRETKAAYEAAHAELKSVRKERAEELNQRDSRIGALEAEHTQLDTDLREQTLAREAAEQALESLSEQHAALEGQLSELRGQLDSRAQDHELLEQELMHAREQTNGQVQELATRIEGLEQEKARLEEESKQQAVARADLEGTIAGLEQELSSGRKQFSEREQSLESAADAARRELEEQGATHRKLEQALEQGRSQIETLEREKGRLELDLREQGQAREQALRVELEGAREELEQQQAARRELEVSLDEVRERADQDTKALTEQVAALEQDKARLESELGAEIESREQALRVELEGAREELEQQQVAYRELEASLDEVRERAEQDTRALTEQVAALEQDKARLESELGAEIESREQALREELLAAREELEQQQAAYRELEASLDEVRERGEQGIKALAEQVAGLEQDKAGLDSELQRQAEARDQAERQQSSHAAEVARLQNNVDSLSEELSVRVEERDALRNELAAVRQAQETNGQEINERLVQLEHDNSALESRLAQQAEKLAAAEQDTVVLGQLREELAREQARREELENSHSEIEGGRAALEQQLDEFRCQHEIETQETQEEVAQLRQRNEQLIDELEQLGKQVANLESGKADAESSFQAMESEVDNWRGEAERAAVELQAAREQAEHDAQDAREELARLRRELEDRNDSQAREEISSIRAQADKELIQASQELKRLREQARQSEVALRAAEQRIRQMESELVLAHQLAGQAGNFQADLGQARTEVEAHLAQYKQETEALVRQAKEENVALRSELEQLRRESVGVHGSAGGDDSVIGMSDEQVHDVFDLAEVDERIFKQEHEQHRRGKGRMLALMLVVLLLGAGGGAGGLWYLDRMPVPASVATGVAPGEPSHRVPSSIRAATKAVSFRGPARHSTKARVQTPRLPVNSMRPGRTYQDLLSGGGEGPVMVQVPPGRFAMGISDNFPYFNERPRHTVKLRGFSISKYEVTFAQYDRFAAATGRHQPGDAGWGRGNRPVVNVSWNDAVAYTKWLSDQTGHHYRLATEAQWEYAARAGTATYFWWGDTPGHGHADCFNCGSRWDGQSTAPVGSFKPNALGLFDTAGNVMEWVQDCYHASYAGAPKDGSAWTASTCSKRVARGGSYRTPVDNLRASGRQGLAPDTRLDSLGFRVVREP